jgi:hypothetical protein
VVNSIERFLSRSLIAAYFLAATMPLTACTDSGLKKIVEDLTYFDDKLAVSGEFCTNTADEVTFPVKILFVMDQSASLQCTDPGNNRMTALNQAGGPLDALENVEFGVVGFASWSRITNFTGSWGEARDALSLENGQGGPATDYQGALSDVLRMLEQDMIDSGPAERARTKYIILFISDGLPEPRCVSGCDDGDIIPDALYGVCNTTETIPDGEYVDMHTLCPDYNQPEQIMQKVEDVMALGDFYSVGDIQLNSIFLFAPEADIAAICGDVAQFGYVREEAEPILREMAETGLGTFRDVNVSTQIDFLEFDYESLQAPYDVFEFFSINMSAVPSETGAVTDSDRDGISDAEEFDNGLDPLNEDSDGDHFSDLFEKINATKGFDPLDENVPAMGCGDTQDRDHDGLRGCEEAFLNTDPMHPDSDGDRIPDGIEIRLGLDPTTHDTEIDHDFDGRTSGMEISAGTNPKLVDEEVSLVNQISISLERGALKNNGVRCYNFDISGLTLVPTLTSPDSPENKGLNRILIFAEEEPVGMAGSRGRFQVACIEAKYLGETYKDPPSGRIDGLSPLHFKEIQISDVLNPDSLDCIKLGTDPSAPPDGGVL